MEVLTLTAQETYTARADVEVTNSTYRVAKLTLDWDGARVGVVVVDQHGRQFPASYEGAEATTLMIALNKANLTNNSLHKRALDRLAADGKLPAGTVTGNPD